MQTTSPSSADRTSDESLALRAAQDEAEAFEELVRRYQVPLLRFLARFTRSRHDAEDLLQEAFAKLYAGRRAYRANWPYRTWAFTVTRRVAIDRQRRVAREPAMVSLPEVPHRAGDVMEEGELWALARKKLGPDVLQALWMFHVEAIPPREIARVLGRTWLSVRAMLSRGRRKLKSTIESRQNNPVPREAWGVS